MKRQYTRKRGRLLFAAFLLLIGVMIVSIVNIHAILAQNAAARNEYAGLRELAPTVNYAPAPLPIPGTGAEPEPIQQPALDLSHINPDYIGWIEIDGTPIDYPVVQGEDNTKYLNITFTGEQNPSGAIFMDWQSIDDFEAPLAVLYGHNMKDGSMFAELHSYREDDYLAQHPAIAISTPEGETLTYHIFAVRHTDIWDSLFSLCGESREDIQEYFTGYDAPQGAGRFLALSTCTGSGSKHDRLLIFAALTEPPQ